MACRVDPINTCCCKQAVRQQWDAYNQPANAGTWLPGIYHMEQAMKHLKIDTSIAAFFLTNASYAMHKMQCSGSQARQGHSLEVLAETSRLVLISPQHAQTPIGSKSVC